jgi:glycerate kinase
VTRAGAAFERAPVADGGEGTAEVLQEALGGEWRSTLVNDPLLRSVEARFVLLPDGRGVVESAEAIGLRRVAPDERDPLAASSRGLGELIVASLEAGVTGLIVGLGDSATVDGGAGLLDVLGELPVETLVACDVANPLLGERGAARVFGPQKGASPAEVEALEDRIAARTALAPYADLPGAGAAGGLGAALAALGARLVAGAKFVVDSIGLPERMKAAALVVTGEGIVDRTSLEGKATGYIAEVARAEGVPCVVFGGRVETDVPGAETAQLSGDPRRARDDLASLGEQLALQR